MNVTLELSGWFKRYTDGLTRLELDVKPGTTAIHVVMSTGIPLSEIGFITVRNEKVSHEYVLCDGDSLRVYPTIIGG